MPIRFANNASSQLAASLTSAATTLTVTQGQGALFPALGAGDVFIATIVAADSTYEIVRVTARAVDTFTIVRAREDTTAKAFPIGARIELRMTAGAFVEMMADKLERSGGVLTGPVSSSSTIEADGGFFVGDNEVWHEGNFDPDTKVGTSGNQIINGDKLTINGTSPRTTYTFGANSRSVGLDADGAFVIANGLDLTTDPLLKVSADGNIWGKEHGDFDTWVTDTLNAALAAKATEIMNSVATGYVQDVRLGAQTQPSASGSPPGPGMVMIAWGYPSGTTPEAIWAPLQIKKNGVWFTVGNA
ncbi:hypothetical protein V5F77_04380 [Xanthobacter sp. DSM 24535]|uniref:hypothetical protein n=1 Tax=Roseixanthobacter psychrophilus TaxID=3119917 RepID=UPI00372B500C